MGQSKSEAAEGSEGLPGCSGEHPVADSHICPVSAGTEKTKKINVKTQTKKIGKKKMAKKFQANTCQNVLKVINDGGLIRCLYNQEGYLCTLHGTRYICLDTSQTPILVSLTGAVSGLGTGGLLWDDVAPSHIKDHPDGTKVMVDALAAPNTTSLVAILVWRNTKPSRITLPPPHKNTDCYYFLGQYTCPVVSLVSLTSRTAVIAVMVEGKERFLMMPTSIVCMKGNNQQDLCKFFSAFFSFSVYVTINVFADVNTLKVNLLPECVWTGQRDLPIKQQLTPVNIYTLHEEAVLVKEQTIAYFDVLCEVQKSRRDLTLHLPTTNGHYKAIPVKPQQLFFRQQRVKLTGTKWSARAHLTKTRCCSEQNTCWNVLMVQLIKNMTEVNWNVTGDCKIEGNKKINVVKLMEALLYPHDGQDRDSSQSRAALEEVMANLNHTQGTTNTDIKREVCYAENGAAKKMEEKSVMSDEVTKQNYEKEVCEQVEEDEACRKKDSSGKEGSKEQISNEKESSIYGEDLSGSHLQVSGIPGSEVVEDCQWVSASISQAILYTTGKTIMIKQDTFFVDGAKLPSGMPLVRLMYEGAPVSATVVPVEGAYACPVLGHMPTHLALIVWKGCHPDTLEEFCQFRAAVPQKEIQLNLPCLESPNCFAETVLLGLNKVRSGKDCGHEEMLVFSQPTPITDTNWCGRGSKACTATGTFPQQDTVVSLMLNPALTTVWEHHTCQVVEAANSLALLIAIDKFIILKKEDFFCTRAKVSLSGDLAKDLAVHPRLRVLAADLRWPLTIMGVEVTQVALLAWGGPLTRPLARVKRARMRAHCTLRLVGVTIPGTRHKRKN